VAPQFFSQRAEGPRNVSKSPTVAAAAATAAQPVADARPADGKGPVSSPVSYEIRIGDRSHKVSVQPA